MAAQNTRDADQVQPDQRHHREPEKEARQREPSRCARAAESQNDGDPQRQSLHEVAQHEAVGNSDAAYQRGEHHEATDGDYDRRVAGRGRGHWQALDGVCGWHGALFITQRDDGVNPHGATRRNVAREERDEDKDDRDSNERERIVRGDTEKLTRH